MKVVITGASGFVGGCLTDAVLEQKGAQRVSQLVLVDARAPAPRADPRVQCRALQLGAPGAADTLVDADTDVIYHLAAVVSGEAERDFDLGMRVNLDATRDLLEAVRHRAPRARFVFASTSAVLGGDLPACIDEAVATMPQTSYGTAKAICELLVNDYSRRGFVDGCAVRLPTVTVRAGSANAAVTSFASGVVREPLHGQRARLPVEGSQEMWVSSPRAVVRALMRAGDARLVPGAALGAWRVLSLPGLRVSVADMVAALRRLAGDRVADLVYYDIDEDIARMVASFPIEFDTTKAFRLGFEGVTSFDDIIRDYMNEIQYPSASHKYK